MFGYLLYAFVTIKEHNFVCVRACVCVRVGVCVRAYVCVHVKVYKTRHVEVFGLMFSPSHSSPHMVTGWISLMSPRDGNTGTINISKLRTIPLRRMDKRLSVGKVGLGRRQYLVNPWDQ